jgi:hypothetical protein
MTGPVLSSGSGRQQKCSQSSSSLIIPRITSAQLLPPVETSCRFPAGGSNRHGRIVVRAVHGTCGGNRSRCPDNHYRDEPPHAVPASSRACKGGTRDPSQPWPVARSLHRGAVTMSYRLAVCLVSCLVRASARKREHAGHETRAETSTESSGGGGVTRRRQGHQPAYCG